MAAAPSKPQKRGKADDAGGVLHHPGTTSTASRLLWERFHGILVTGLVILLIAVVARALGPIPMPAAFLAMSVAYAAASGGLLPGLISSGVAILGYVFLVRVGPPQPAPDSLLQIIVGAITMSASAFIVGLLKDANDRLRQEGIRAAVAARAREIESRALRESEARLRRLFDAGVVGMVFSDMETRVVTEANDLFLRMVGYTRDDLAQGRISFDALFSPGWEKVARNSRRILEERGVLEPLETEFRRRDGTRIPVLLGAAALDSGRETVAFLLDISEQKRLENDLAAASAHQQRIAETLQRSLLLSPAEDAFPGLKVATYYEAASDEAKVGGDFFDAFLLEDGRVALVVGDVMGKGLTAATRTAEVRFGLRAFLRDDSAPTAAASLARLNRFLFSSNVRDAAVIVAGDDEAAILPRGFICLSLALVDPRTGEAEVATAGAELPLVLRARTGTVEPALDPQDPRERGLCPLLGVDPDAGYSTATLRLEPGDALLMLTDGLPEARRPGTVDFFGSAQLARGFTEAATRPPSEALRLLADGARRFAGGTLRDDVCLLLAVCEPSAPVPSETPERRPVLSSP